MSRETLCAQQGLLGLNEDVLLEIVSHLDAASANNLSATARGIHPIAQRQALSNLEINVMDNLHGYEMITEMCTYMLDDIPGRLHCVKSLKIRVRIIEECHPSGTGPYDKITMPARRKLAQFLENAIQLQSLKLYPFGNLITLEPRLKSAIHALPNLRCLNISDLLDLSPCVQEFLLTMRHQLQKLRVADLWTDMTEYRVLPALRNMKMTDLDLDLSQDFACRRSSNTLNGPHHPYFFPDVRKLSLSLPDENISMSTLVRAFPNIRALRIHRCGSFTSTEAACWESLDSVEGPVGFFEQWSPTCHIPHVSISSRLAKPHFDTPSSATTHELKPTLCLIRKASPVALTLLIMADPGLTDSFWIPLTKCTPRLRSLEIHLYTFPEGDVMPRLFACKNVISAALGLMPTVMHLRLSVVYSWRRIGTEIDQIQPEEWALQLLEQAPSVRCVSLSFTSCRRYFPHDTKTTAWKVVGARTCRKLERITEALEEDVQRRIIAPDFDPRTSL